MIYFISIWCIMSLFTFTLYAIDKKKAMKQRYRVKEKTLFIFSLLLGALGALLAMQVFRHKTKHWYFYVINWIALLVHGLLFYLIYINPEIFDSIFYLFII